MQNPNQNRIALLALGFGLASLAASGCGGTATEAEAPGEAAPSETPAGENANTAAGNGGGAKSASPKAKLDDETVPTSCETHGDLCAPNKAFVKRLCGGVHPDVALAMFRKDTPFSRGYLRMNVDAWNASGGASSQDKLVFDEEVILLVLRQNETGIEVSGASGSYDVLRWDGTCATLSAEEVTTKLPPKPKNANIVWKDLDTPTQDALLADEKIAQLNKERRSECKGATMGAVSKNCVKLVDKLSEAVVAYVRNGGPIPAPAKIK